MGPKKRGIMPWIHAMGFLLVGAAGAVFFQGNARTVNVNMGEAFPGVKNVVIDNHLSSTEFKSSSGSEVRYELSGGYAGGSSKFPLSADRQGETLTIALRNTYGPKEFIDHLFRSIDHQPKLIVYIPEQLDSLYVRMSKDIAFDGIKASTLNINTVSGDIRGSTVAGSSARITTVSGSIVIDKVDAEEWESGSTSGDVKIESASSKRFNLHSTSGDIAVQEANIQQLARLDSVSGSIKAGTLQSSQAAIHTISGDITVQELHAQDSATVESTSGDVELAAAGRTGVVEAEALSGNVVLPAGAPVQQKGKHNSLIQYTLDSKPKLSIHTTSGDIKVN